jgi:hypothetical protein
MLETDIQKALVEYLKLKKIMFFAPLNENNYSFIDRNLAIKIERKAQKMGKVAGVSDLCLLFQHKILFIELKREGGKVSKNQKAFIDRINNETMAEAIVCYGYHNAKSVIDYELEKEIEYVKKEIQV